jgi:hypothetical protein
LSTQPYLCFDVAYARWGSGYTDSLQVVASTDCFVTAQVLYFKGGENLATSPDNQSFFTPTNNQWRKDSVDLSSYANQGNLQIAFRNIGGWGNCIYLDNIHIGSMAAIAQVQPLKRSVYPNPACPGAVLQLNGSPSDFARLIDQKGKEVARWMAGSELKLDDALKAGVYLLQLHSAQLISNHQIVVID